MERAVVQATSHQGMQRHLRTAQKHTRNPALGPSPNSLVADSQPQPAIAAGRRIPLPAPRPLRTLPHWQQCFR